MAPWRLLYKDSNNDNTVLGVMKGTVPSGAYTVKHSRWKTRNRATDKLSFVAEADMFGNLPVKLSDFGTSEPAVFFQARRFNGVAVQSVDTGNDTVTVSGDRTNDFEEGGAIDIDGSTGNDGIYKVAEQSDVSYDSNADETTITVVEDITDSTADGTVDGYENIFRGFFQNQGAITEDGNHKALLWDFSLYTGREHVTISTAVTTNIKDAMDNVLPSGYTLDTPSSGNVTYIDSTGSEQSGFAPVDDYTLDDQRKVGYRELTKRYGWTLKFKADKTVRYEPIGFGSSIDTIDSRAEGETNNTRGTFKEWTRDRTDNIVNTIKVVNDVDGNRYVSGVITNSTSVNDYGTRTPPSGLTQKVGYVNSDAEAKRVAENIVKDDNNPTEGGVVSVAGRYTNNVSNSSFTLNDSVRGINSDVFVAWEQVNFYPENRSELQFQFESNAELEAGVRDDIRAERSKTISASSTQVGQQGVTNVDTGSAPSDTAVAGSVSNNPSDTALTGSLENAGAANEANTFTTSFSDSTLSVNGSFENVSGTGVTLGSETTLLVYYAILRYDWNESGSGGSTQSVPMYVRMHNSSIGEYFPDTTGYLITDGHYDNAGGNIFRKNQAFYLAAVIGQSSNANFQWANDNIDLQIDVSNNSGTPGVSSAIIEGRIMTMENHVHNDGYATQDNNHGHGDNFSTNDNQHGGAGDATGQHGTSGQTDSKNINVASEQKEDR